MEKRISEDYGIMSFYEMGFDDALEGNLEEELFYGDDKESLEYIKGYNDGEYAAQLRNK